MKAKSDRGTIRESCHREKRDQYPPNATFVCFQRAGDFDV
jgi:hypothetical protein